MYIIFSILAALIGGGFSIFMRMELMEPGVQYMADGHVWNVFTTAHGLDHGVLCGDAGSYWRFW